MATDELSLSIASAVTGYSLTSPSFASFVKSSQFSLDGSSISPESMGDTGNLVHYREENPANTQLTSSPLIPQFNQKSVVIRQPGIAPNYQTLEVQPRPVYKEQSDQHLSDNKWEWEGIATSKMKFSHLLPDVPLAAENLSSGNNNAQMLPNSVLEEGLKFVESLRTQTKVPKQYFCTGYDGKRKAHIADEETFMRKAMCKECFYEAFDELSKKQTRKESRAQAPRKDETLIKIEGEINKLDTKSRLALEKAIPEKYRRTGSDMKERLRGIGMGHHPENKTRKLDQFEHSSVLALYGYDVQCITLVYDHSKKNMFLYGAPEIRDALEETSSKLKEVNKKTHLDGAMSLFKTLFKKSPKPPVITSSVQSSASTVWNNSFSSKKNTAEALDEDDSQVQTISSPSNSTDNMERSCPPSKKAKTNSTISEDNSDQSSKAVSNIAEFSDFDNFESKDSVTNQFEPEKKKIEILEGIIMGYDYARCSVVKVCAACLKKEIVTELNESSYPQYCFQCFEEVIPVDHGIVTVEVEVKNSSTLSTEKAFVQLSEENMVSLLPKENPTAAALIGRAIGPMWLELKGDVWIKYTPVLNKL